MRRLSASCCHLTLCSSSLNAIKTTFTSNCHADGATNTLFFSAPPAHFLLTPTYYLSFCPGRAWFFLNCQSGPTVNISSIALRLLNRFRASRGKSRIPISDSHAEPFFGKYYCCQTSTLRWPQKNSPFKPSFFSHKVPSPPFGFQKLEVIYVYLGIPVGVFFSFSN